MPVSSVEEGQGGNAGYECCTFRGSLVALNAGTGAVVWKTYTIEDEPRAIGKNPGGATRWGPSGAGIWARRRSIRSAALVYAATGNMYTEPQQPTSDAVMAFTLDAGKIAWTKQVTPQDVFVVGCSRPRRRQLSAERRSRPRLRLRQLADARRRSAAAICIVIGQKSGVGWALDPDKQGAVVWQYRAGQGSALGGMEWGSAVDAERAYFPVADVNGPQAGAAACGAPRRPASAPGSRRRAADDVRRARPRLHAGAFWRRSR